MSYQVGAFCFATPADAGAAACSRFEPVSAVVDGGLTVRSVSCQSADAVTGALNLKITSSAVDGSGSTSAMISQQIAFSDCQESQYIQAAEVVFGALLAVVVPAWCLWKLCNFLGWSRGSAE